MSFQFSKSLQPGILSFYLWHFKPRLFDGETEFEISNVYNFGLQYRSEVQHFFKWADYAGKEKT